MNVRYEKFDSPAGTFAAVSGGEDSGQPMVLLHGFGGGGIGWLSTIVHLERQYRILAPDLPGHGGSKALFDQPDLDSLAQALEQMIAGAGIDTPHIVAHSLGGAIALQLLKRGRVTARSLTLLACAGLTRRYDPSFFKAYISASTPAEMRDVLQRTVEPAFVITPVMVRSALAEVAANRLTGHLSQIVEAAEAGMILAPLEALNMLQGPLK